MHESRQQNDKNYEDKIEYLEKRVAELEKNEEYLKQQLKNVTHAVDESNFARMAAYGTSLLELFGTQADIENIVANKSVEEGYRTDNNAEPTSVLTSKYPKVRVAYRTKKLVEAEAIDRNGKTRNSTYLFRILMI